MSGSFGPGFFDRADETSDADFYSFPRFVTHIDEAAIEGVGALYDELGLTGDVLDLMSSWVSHFRKPPASLTVLGMNAAELEGNPMATSRVVHDLNANPALPFPEGSFDAVTCCVSIDYLSRPIEVFRSVRGVLRPGGPLVCTFSNRLFPTKAIRGWLYATEAERLDIAAAYFAASGGWGPVSVQRRPAGHDPLYAVWAHRA